MAGVKIVGVFIVSLCLIASLSQATDVSYCNKNANYDVKVSRIDINPNPVLSGQPANFSIYATTGEQIDAGKLVIEVIIFGFSIHTESHDLCQKTTCPVSPGSFVVSHSQVLPGFTPPGDYTLRMKMMDGKKQLTCIIFEFEIKWGSSVADS